MSARGRKSDDSKKKSAGKGAGKRASEKDAGRKAAAKPGLEARRLGLAVFGVALLVLFAGVAITGGLGKPSLPDDGVAVIGDMPEGDYVITEEEFERSLEQMAAQMELPEVPEREDPQWNEVAQNTMLTELDVAWLRGEAAERDIDVTGAQVNSQLDMIATQEFECDPEAEPFECEEFREFMDEVGFTEDEVRELVEVGVLSNEILNRVIEDAPDPTERELRNYYETFEEQFVVPASTDARVIENEERSEVVEAMRALEQDASPENWEEVAEEYSEDTLSADQGGLREGVTEGMFEAPVQEAIDEAEPGELVGPIETEAAFFAIQVEARNPERVQEFDEVREQLEQQVSQQLTNDVQEDFFNSYTERWTQRTICAEEYLNERCSNADGENVFLTAEQREQQEEATADAAPVLAERTVWPKPPDTLASPIGAVTANGTQIICYLAEAPEDQGFPLTGTAPPQRPHPPGRTEDIVEVPEGVNPDEMPPTCGAASPMGMFGGPPVG